MSIDADYLSITWDEMLQATGAPRRRPFEHSQVNKAVMGELIARQGIRATLPTGVALNRKGSQVCAQTRHIDALGLLLMQRRLRSAPLFNGHEVFAIRQWLDTARLMFAFRVNRHLFLQAFFQTYPELGPLTGDNGVRMITNKASLQRAWYRFYDLFLEFGRLEILWHSPFAPERTDICLVSDLDETSPRWLDLDAQSSI